MNPIRLNTRRGEIPATRYLHRTPPDPSKDPTGKSGWDPDAAGDTLTDALREVLPRLSRHVHASLISANTDVDDTAADSFLLFAVGPATLHIVGASELADQARTVIRDGALGGWQLLAMPETTTPLHALRDSLESRVYNLLERNGFNTAEEVAAVPDKGFLQLGMIGPKFVEAIRGVPGIGTPPYLEVKRPHAGDTADRLAFLHEHLTPVAAARYRTFTEALSRSSLPIAALEKIIEALNAEPIPPADATVTLLLDTAGEHHLLDDYLTTHTQP